MCARPDIQIVESGKDIQLISVTYYGPLIPGFVVGHVNPQGRRLDFTKLGWLLFLFSLFAACKIRIIHVPGINDVIYCLVGITVPVLPDAVARKGWVLINIYLSIILDIFIFVTQIGNEDQYPFDLMVKGSWDEIVM